MVKIYVGNVSFSVTEAKLRSLFEAYGSVASVTLVTDRDSGQLVAIAPRIKLRRAIMVGSPNGWLPLQFINSIRLRAPASIRYH